MRSPPPGPAAASRWSPDAASWRSWRSPGAARWCAPPGSWPTACSPWWSTRRRTRGRRTRGLRIGARLPGRPAPGRPIRTYWPDPAHRRPEGADMPGRPLTVLFMPESAYGPTNNCIGIGDVLRRRGHRVVFAAEASWKGRLEPLGFEEDLVDLSPPGEQSDPGQQVEPGQQGEQDAGAFWKEFIARTAPE